MRRLADEGWLSSSLFLSRLKPVTKKRTLRWKAWTKFASWLWSGCKRRDHFRCHEETGDVQWVGTIDWGCSGVNGRNVFREGFKNAENKLDVWTKRERKGEKRWWRFFFYATVIFARFIETIFVIQRDSSFGKEKRFSVKLLRFFRGKLHILTYIKYRT